MFKSFFNFFGYIILRVYCFISRFDIVSKFLKINKI